MGVFAVICAQDYMSKLYTHIMHKKYIGRVSEVAGWGKALLTQPDDLSSIPGPTRKKESANSHKISLDHHKCNIAYIHTQINECLKIP